MHKKIFQKLGLVNTSFIILLLLCLLWFLIAHRNICLWLTWNMLLAWVTVIFVRAAVQSSRTWIFWVFIILGILFLPNTFYIFTDLIHVNSFNFYQLHNHYSVIYTESLTPWIELFLVVAAAIFGWLLGLESIKLIAKKFHRPILVPIVLSILCGFGIWIGRFLRLNSWDIFRPNLIIEQVSQQANWFMLSFSLLFALVIFVSYLIFSQISPLAKSSVRQK